MMKEFELWKKTEVTGCVYEDESDTRKFSENFFLVSQEDEESFGESMADDYGYSDYNNYIKIADLDTSEVLKLAEVFEKFKQDYENKQMLNEIEEIEETGVEFRGIPKF